MFPNPSVESPESVENKQSRVFYLKSHRGPIYRVLLRFIGSLLHRTNAALAAQRSGVWQAFSSLEQENSQAKGPR